MKQLMCMIGLTEMFVGKDISCLDLNKRYSLIGLNNREIELGVDRANHRVRGLGVQEP
jgi:hypothetical protein